MSFQDAIIDSLFEGNFGVSIEVSSVVLTLTIACILGIYIFAIYRLVSRNKFYQKEFAISLPMLGLVTAAIILAIQSSVVISLGMVGALSIVRFRTAIKSPIDLVFLFWSISMGIICGATIYELAIIVSILLTILVLALDKIPMGKVPALLIINMNTIEDENLIIQILDKYCSLSNVKTRNMSEGHMDMMIEIRVKEEEKLIIELQKLSMVESVSLLEHDGDVNYA